MGRHKRDKLKIRSVLITPKETLIVTLENDIYSLESLKLKRKLLKAIEKEISIYLEALE